MTAHAAVVHYISHDSWYYLSDSAYLSLSLRPAVHCNLSMFAGGSVTRGMGLVPDWLVAKFQENPFLQSLWLAPLVLVIFYYVGLGFGWVEKKHAVWVKEQNARNAAAAERKLQ